MLTRRTLLEWLGSVTGMAVTRLTAAAAQGVADTVGVMGPPPGSYAALAGQPVQWVFDDAAGSFEPAIDFFKSYDWHIPQDVLDQARRGLVENIGPEQLRGLELRRDREQMIWISTPFCDSQKPDASEPARVHVYVCHWSRRPRRVGAFVRGLHLDPRGVIMHVRSLREGVSRWANGADYLAGGPLVEGPDDLEMLARRWWQRESPAAPDWTCATPRDWSLRWPQLAGPGIPWAALASAWKSVSGPTCGHCDFPMLLWGFGHTRVGDGREPEGPVAAAVHRWWPRSEPPRAVAEFVCVGCAKRWQEPITDLDAWIEAHLEPGVRPACGRVGQAEDV